MFDLAFTSPPEVLMWAPWWPGELARAAGEEAERKREREGSSSDRLREPNGLCGAVGGWSNMSRFFAPSLKEPVNTSGIRFSRKRSKPESTKFPNPRSLHRKLFVLRGLGPASRNPRPLNRSRKP